MSVGGEEPVRKSRARDMDRMRRLAGGLLGLAGLVILLRAVPPGLWLVLAGAALLFLGYALFTSPGGVEQ